MAYRFQWLLEDRVLMAEWSGSVDMEQLTQHNQEAEALMPPGQVIHFIAEFSQLEKNNLSLKDIQNLARESQQKSFPGWHVSINPKRLERMMVNIGAQFFGIKSRQFATLGEGLAFLQSMDESLPDLAALMAEKEPNT